MTMLLLKPYLVKVSMKGRGSKIPKIMSTLFMNGPLITLLMILLTTILSFLLQEMPKPSVMITPHALEDSCRCVLIPSSRSKAASSRIIYWSNPGLLHNHHKRETTMYSISSQLQLRFVSQCIMKTILWGGMKEPPPPPSKRGRGVFCTFNYVMIFGISLYARWE